MQGGVGPGPTSTADDLSAATALFHRNIEAIQNKDRAAYLACYLDTDALIRAGDQGVNLGFSELATATSTSPEQWPRSLEATDMTVYPVATGIVYGNYRYRVTFGETTTTGWSERVFIKTEQGWRIAVTTAFQSPATADAD